MPRIPRLVLSLLVLTGFAARSSATTWIVDAARGPGAHFASIQAAVDAATDGDLILVRRGGYHEHVVVDGKALTLQALPGAGILGVVGPATLPHPLLHVTNLAPGQEVHVRRFHFLRISGVAGDTLRLSNARGRVWLEELFLDSYDGPSFRIEDASEVVLRNVYAQSNAAFLDPQGVPRGSEGLVIERSSVQAFDVTGIGSHGGPIFSTPSAPAPGGDGIRIVDSTVHLVEPELSGGTGGTFSSGSCLHGAIGGSALRILAVGTRQPIVSLRGGRLRSGASGTFTPGCASDPGSAPIIFDPHGALTASSGRSRLLHLPTLPANGGSFELQLTGAPLDLHLLILSLATATATPLANVDGDLHVSPLLAVAAFPGQLDAFGRGVVAGSFVSPGEPVTVHLQAVLLDGSAGLWLTNPASILFP